MECVNINSSFEGDIDIDVFLITFKSKCDMKKLTSFKRTMLCLCFLLGVGGLKAQNIDTLSWIWERKANDEIAACVNVTPNEAFTVDWGDGSTEIFVPNKEFYGMWHIYAVSGTYTVTVVGSPTCHFTRLTFNSVVPPNNVIHIKTKCQNCIHFICSGQAVGVGGFSTEFWGKLRSIDIKPENNPNLKNAGVKFQDNQLRLSYCYMAAASSKYVLGTGAWTISQFLEPRIVARGDTIDFSADTAFIHPDENKLYHTNFEVFKRDSQCYPIRVWISDEQYTGYCVPADPGDYSEGNGILAFYRPGEYIIKMTNPAVLSSTSYSYSDPTIVYQQIFLPPNNDACLASLSVSGGILTPVFECDTLHYTVDVACVSSVIITALPSDTFATVTGDIGLQSLQVGSNLFTITVTAEDDSTTKTYTVLVNLLPDDIRTDTINAVINHGDTYNLNGFNENQAGTYQHITQTAAGCDSLTVLILSVNSIVLNTDACLTNITVSEGVLTPKFECDTLNYTVDVLYKVSSVIITATASDSNATVSGDVGLQPLQVGVNIFYITVTAEDGITTKTYTVRITRAEGGTEACLFTLTVLSEVSENEFREEKLYPATVSCNILMYLVSVEHSISSAIINATATDTNAKVTGTGKKQLQVGTNIFPISVTSETGNMQRVYKVEINRAGENGIDPKKDLFIYPNPTDGRLYVVNYEPSMGDIGIYDALGKSLMQAKVKNENKNEKGEIVIDILHLANGVYFVTVYNEGQKIVRKFVKE